MTQKGFSFVELLITVAILSFVLAVTYGVLSTGRTIFNNDTYALDVYDQARNGLDKIIREVRESSSQTITTVSANYDRITFSTPNETGIQYYVTSNILYREYPSGTASKVASDIARLKFSYSNKLLTVDIRSDKLIGSKTYSIALRDKVKVRNQ